VDSARRVVYGSGVVAAPSPEMPQDQPPRPAPAPPEPQSIPQRPVVELALRLALIGLFLFLAIDLLLPFLDLGLWIVVIAAALHPAFVWLRDRLGGRPLTAAVLVTLAALAVTLGPIAMLAASLVHSAEWLTARVVSGAVALPEPPRRLTELPLVGKAIASNWALATTNLEGFLARHGATLIGAGERAARPAIHAAESAAVILTAVALAGFLLIPGERLAGGLRAATRRLVGEAGARFVELAGATVRNVARGVIGVALIQALAVGVALIAAGVPGAGLLTLAALILAIVQIGVAFVTAPVILWAWLSQDGLTAALLTAYLVPVTFADIPLKPLMLGRAMSTPATVIFAGVIAGTVSYGLIGLFLGPILLAIAYEVVRSELGRPAPPPSPPAGG
jgi:predicted PurR-regulated permease PerM